MKKNWKMIIGLILAFIMVIFAILNREEAIINFGFVQLKQPLIILILGSTLLGVLISFLLSSASLLGKNRQIKNLQKEMTELKASQSRKIDAKVEAAKKEYEQLLGEKEEAIHALEEKLAQHSSLQENHDEV